MSKSPVTDFGVTCIFPQIPGIPPYHNDAIWPFVQSYWNLAAAKAGNEQALNHGLAAIYRAGALFLTNYENFVAGTGDFDGTEINSDRMLWSMAGNLAMVHRVFMGMSFEADGIRFQPVVPKTYGGKKTLSNFHYRNAVLNITVNGFGNKVKSILLDGKPLKDAFLPATTAGMHVVEIELQNNDFSQQPIQLVPNLFTLPNPQARRDGNLLKWDAVDGASQYRVYKNGQFLEKTAAAQLEIKGVSQQFAEYKVSALDQKGNESFSSEPVVFVNDTAVKIFEMETFYAGLRPSVQQFFWQRFCGNQHGKKPAYRMPYRRSISGGISPQRTLFQRQRPLEHR